jgi:hypothetical protein
VRHDFSVAAERRIAAEDLQALGLRWRSKR